ncbi:hypothetical protein JNUCC64_19840 [Streptomyces sp. JNUCC 64]
MGEDVTSGAADTGASAALAELVGTAREEAEGRAGDSSYRESGGWESVVDDVDFWFHWNWDEVKDELADQAGERDLHWETVEPAVRSAFSETFRENFG